MADGGLGLVLQGGVITAIVGVLGVLLRQYLDRRQTTAAADRDVAEAGSLRVSTASEVVELVRSEMKAQRERFDARQAETKEAHDREIAALREEFAAYQRAREAELADLGDQLRTVRRERDDQAREIDRLRTELDRLRDEVTG